MTATRHDLVRTEPKSLELREEHLALAPVMDMKAAKTALDELAKFVREQLVEGTGPDADYGKIPGTNKPSLYQPGAQKIAFYFGLTPVPTLEREIMTAEFCSKTYTVTMVDRRSGREVAACSGSCNSMESRFFKKGKATYVDARETENTCDKMAQKRALVGATIIATRAAGLFTQDVEDLPKAALGQDEEEGDERPRPTRGAAPEQPGAVKPNAEKLFPMKGPFKDKPLGEMPLDAINGYVNWIADKQAEKKDDTFFADLRLALIDVAKQKQAELERDQTKLFEQAEEGTDPTKTPADSSSTDMAGVTPSRPQPSGAEPSTSAPGKPASGESSSAVTADQDRSTTSPPPKSTESSSPSPTTESLPDPAAGLPFAHPLKFKPNTTPEGVLALEALENTDPDEATIYDLSRIIKAAIEKGPFEERERSSLMSLYAGSGNSKAKLRTVKKGVLATARNLPF